MQLLMKVFWSRSFPWYISLLVPLGEYHIAHNSVIPLVSVVHKCVSVCTSDMIKYAKTNSKKYKLYPRGCDYHRDFKRQEAMQIAPSGIWIASFTDMISSIDTTDAIALSL